MNGDSKTANIARALAIRLHADQVDKAGLPYVDHLAAVVAILMSRWPNAAQDEIDAAWLHDALEDTSATEADLLQHGISPRACEIIRALTRPSRELIYMDWIKNMARDGDVSVLRVKLADNAHNSDPARALPHRDMIRRRYLPEKVMLEKGLAAAEERAGA